MKTTSKLMLAALCLLMSISLYSQIIPENRIVNWENAGLIHNISENVPVVDVTDFGASGDGISNDSPAIEAA